MRLQRMQYRARHGPGPAKGRRKDPGRNKEEVMQKFTVHKGLVAPMDRENVDTDAIIPKQFLKSIRKTGFRRKPVRRLALSGSGFPGPGPGQPQAQSGLRAEPAPLRRRIDPAGTQELRLRIVARACALGARPVWLSRHPGAEFCRHLLQQQLQERPVADRAARSADQRAVRRGCGLPGLQPDRRPRAPGHRAAAGRGNRRSTFSRFASTACSTASTTSV